MDATNLILLMVGALLGLGAAWLFWHGSVKRDVVERVESNLATARHRIEAAEADRLAISGQALELQRALRAERSLLDGVAAQAGIAPHDFRRTLARDVLHLSDPYRSRYLDEPIELERRVGQLAEMKLGARPMLVSADLDTTVADQLEVELAATRRELDRRKAELDQVIEESRIVAGELATTEQQLDATHASMRELRDQVRQLLGARSTASPSASSWPAESSEPMVAGATHWSDPMQRVGSLSEEISALRTRLADRALERDQLVNRLAQYADVDRLLDYIVAELDRLRSDVVDRQVPAEPGD